MRPSMRVGIEDDGKQGRRRCYGVLVDCMLAEVVQLRAFFCLDMTVGTVNGIHCAEACCSPQDRQDDFPFKDGT
jgi:hypothetical protein